MQKIFGNSGENVTAIFKLYESTTLQCTIAEDEQQDGAEESFANFLLANGCTPAMHASTAEYREFFFPEHSHHSPPFPCHHDLCVYASVKERNKGFLPLFIVSCYHHRHHLHPKGKLTTLSSPQPFHHLPIQHLSFSSSGPSLLN